MPSRIIVLNIPTKNITILHRLIYLDFIQKLNVSNIIKHSYLTLHWMHAKTMSGRNNKSESELEIIPKILMAQNKLYNFNMCYFIRISRSTYL